MVDVSPTFNIKQTPTTFKEPRRIATNQNSFEVSNVQNSQVVENYDDYNDIPPQHVQSNEFSSAPKNRTKLIVMQNVDFPCSFIYLAIFVTILINILFGIIAIIFSVLSINAKNKNLIEEAKFKGKISLYLSITGIFLTLLIAIFMVFYAIYLTDWIYPTVEIIETTTTPNLNLFLDLNNITF